MMMTIPDYPKFRRLNMEDKTIFQSISAKLAPYVECSFLEMYAWNQHRNPTQVSILNNNLILKTDDFLRDAYTTTFIGRNSLYDTTVRLVEDYGYISNIHEPILRNIKRQLKTMGYRFTVETDKVDYLINTSDFITLRGGNFENFRRLVRKFDNNYANTTVEQLVLDSSKDFSEIINLFKHWGKASSTVKEFQLQSGIDCLQTLHAHHQEFTEIDGLLLKVEGNLIGFSINERKKKNFAVGHFLISDKTYKGSFEKLIWEVVYYYKKNHYETINIGYDLGIDSLRATKTKIFDKLYKKYCISRI
ncbi:MAG: hypothetical protein RLY61_42 [Candidatus Parcubacteria bacterium]|jgi:hypothetical protein